MAQPRIDSQAEPVLPALIRQLEQLRRRGDDDPFTNPILLQALHIQRRIEDGSLPAHEVQKMIQDLTTTAFEGRARRLREHHGEVDRARNEERVRELVRGLAQGAGFEELRSRLERTLFGFVVTAHPTFSLAVALQQDLVTLAQGVGPDGAALDEAARSALLDRVRRAEHRPDQPLDLEEEHRQSVAAIAHLRKALRRVYEIALEVAQDHHPERWQELSPRLVTVATWVGYDMDGRSDIAWTATFAKRLEVEALQLAEYRDRLRALRDGLRPPPAIARILELIEARLALAVKDAREEIEVFEGHRREPDGWRERLAATARAMVHNRAGRLTDSVSLLNLIEEALAARPEDELARSLCVLRAELAHHGLSLARSHVRINAVQLHNAVRKSIGMETAPDDPTKRRSYLQAVTELVEAAEPVRIHFGLIDGEKATARRMFMIIAQMLKYIDGEEPVRFLIAECETPFTMLAALYFARLFGVDHRVDISPLFETRKALEQGADIVAEALEARVFRDYVRRRGRLCLQTGYSDAGRFLGQTAAAVMIERLRLRLCGVLARFDLRDVEVVIFDTHGESIGRGAHPESFADRLRYVDSPETRARFREAGLRVVQETSFQGGDGYLHLASEDMAFATLTRVLEHCLEPADERPDPFYDETVYVDEFFAHIKQYNQAVVDDPCYAALLGAFGTSFLPPSGSRAARRQHDGRAPLVEHTSQLRAIPHNAILQQLGHMANTIGGVGQAVARDPERFQTLYRESPRFRRLIAMVEHAFKFTDLKVLEAYVDLWDPGQWLLQAQRQDTAEGQDELRTLAGHIEVAGLHDKLARILRVFYRDYMDLARALREHRRLTRSAGEEPIAVDLETRDNLHMLHALRIALIMALYRQAVHVPDFSHRHDITHDGVIARILHLDVEAALEILGRVFPIGSGDAPPLDFGEEATYEGSEGQSYAEEHLRLFRPMAERFDLIRRVSSGVVHHIGAIG